MKACCCGLLVLVEQHDHQAGPAAEPAEQRALAHAGGRGDVVGRDRVGAALGDQPAGGLEEQRAVACSVAPLRWTGIGYRQIDQPIGDAHLRNFNSAGTNRTMVRLTRARILWNDRREREMSDTKVLVLLGSLRAASINRQLAELAVETAPEGVSLQLFDRLGSCRSTTKTSTTMRSPSRWLRCVPRPRTQTPRSSSPPSTTAAFLAC